MNKNNRGRRGATLAELAIVIAVIAIMAAMVTSFVVMIDGSRDLSQLKLDAMQDIRLAESVIESFIIESANENRPAYLHKDGATNQLNHKTLYTWYSYEQAGTVSFTGGMLFVRYPEEENRTNISIELQTVKAITFDMLNPENTGDNIYYCTITYNVGGDSDFEYTFCVNPYAGENIKEVTP